MARFAAVLTRLALLAGAALSVWQPALAADDFLEPEKAFQFSARQLDPKTASPRAYAIRSRRSRGPCS